MTMKKVVPDSVIYKICSKAVWESIRHSGEWEGSVDDQRDGFIHFSDAKQVAGTIQRHFASQSDLVVLSVDSRQLGGNLKWEPSRGGDVFPHLYGPLPITAVVDVRDWQGDS